MLDFVEIIYKIREEVAQIHSNPVYSLISETNTIIETIRTEHGNHNIKLNHLLNDIEDYKYLCLNLADMDFKLADDYYNNYDVILINEMLTDKLALKYEPPDIALIDEYKKIKGLV